jgi:hypothetical protein
MSAVDIGIGYVLSGLGAVHLLRLDADIEMQNRYQSANDFVEARLHQ